MPLCIVERYTPYKPPLKMDSRVDQLVGSRFPLFDVHGFSYAAPRRDTGVASVSTYFRAHEDFSESEEIDWIMNLAEDWMDKTFEPFVGNNEILPLEVVISQLEKSTSPGFPWNLVFQKKGNLLVSPIFSDYYTRYWNELCSWDTFWTVSQKYEMRSAEKLNQPIPNIRTFTGSSTEHVAALNQYCLDFNNKFYYSSHFHFVPSFVGATKYYKGFDYVMKKLQKFKRGFCMDASKFDQSQSPYLLRKNFLMRKRYLKFNSEDDVKRFLNLYEATITSTLVLEDGSVYRTPGGMKSGCGNTIVDNTLTLCRLLYASFIKLAPSDEFRSFSYFIENVVMFLNGDDSIISAHENVLLWWNPEMILPFILKFGVKFTCDKGLTEVENLDFLNSTFKKVDGVYLAQPNIQKLTSNLLYNPKSHHPLYVLLKLCNYRIEMWSYPELRKDINAMIQEWIRKYVKAEDELIINKDEPPMKLHDVLCNYISDRNLNYLYYGTEIFG